MKGRVILIDFPKERASQAALLVDGRLEDLLLDQPKGHITPEPGEIFWAKIDRLAPKTGGAFVKLTKDHQGFLREAKGLKEGTGILVQAIGYAEAGKAMPVTSRILYRGRRIIHTPGAPGINVSRQIKDKVERARLVSIVSKFVEEKLAFATSPAHTAQEIEEWIANLTSNAEIQGDPRQLVEEFELNAQKSKADYVETFTNGGFIVRSAASEAPEDELVEELDRVVAQRFRPDELANEDSQPQKVVGRTWAFDQLIREWCWPLPSAIVACPGAYKVLSRVTELEGMPKLPSWGEFASRELHARLQLDDTPDLFDHYGVWDQIEKLKTPHIDLPSGAWMAVETTRAMVTVDVNTAGEFGGGASLTANLQAAKELPRQLRLRGLGGQIIIDFAPLKKTDRKRIEEALKAAFRKDPIETTLAGWTPLGNFELQRKRERRPLAELLA